MKTNWIMHEYRLLDNISTSKPQIADLTNRKASLRLDDWVLCWIYKKNNAQRPMEWNKDYTMVGMVMLATVPTRSNQNPSDLTSKATSYGSLLHHEDNFFEGILSDHGMRSSTSNISQLAVSSSSKQNFHMGFTLKRTLPPQYWNEPNSTGSEPGKRFQQDDLNCNSRAGNIDDTNPFVSLLSQLPQNTPFYPGTIVGSLGDGVSRQQVILPSS